MENWNTFNVVACLIIVVFVSNVVFKAWRRGNKNTGLLFGLWICTIILAMKIIGV